MILEYSQLLSTTHRVLDGILTDGFSVSGRKKTSYTLKDDRESIFYSSTHVNHPSAVWVRQSASNYKWLHSLLVALCKEYTYRYGKVHKCEQIGLVDKLSMIPLNIPHKPFTEPTPAMPEEVRIDNNSILSYQNYYTNNKQHLASWKGKTNSRPVPQWFQTGLEKLAVL